MAKTVTKIGTENIEVVNIAPLLLALDRLKKEVSQDLGGNNQLQGELGAKIESIIKETEIKTVGERINDLTQIISKSPEISSRSEVGVMAKKIELAAEELSRKYPNELELLKKEEFVEDLQKEAKELNPGLNDDQLKSVKDYGELVAENSFNENPLDDYQNEALEANKEFGPGKLENSWSDLKQVVNFIQKSPQEIKDVKEKYNSIKDKLKNVNLPSNLKEVRSFEKMVSSLSNSYVDDLLSGTNKYLGWADRVNKLTGGWLNKTVTKTGQKIVSKIGNQSVQEFAKSGLEKIASEGFEKGFTNILKGVFEGGIKATTSTGGAAAAGAEVVSAAGSAVAGVAGEAVVGATTVASGAAATGAAGVAGGTAAGATVVGGAAAAGGAGVVGGAGATIGTVVGGTAAAGGGAAVGAPVAAGAAIVVVVVLVGLFIYQLLQGFSVSSLTPPKGEIAYENVIENNDSGKYQNINSPTVFWGYQLNGITLYVFEENSDGGRMQDRYDLNLVDGGIWLESVGEYAVGSNNLLDKRVKEAYVAMVEAGRASGQLSYSDDLMLISGYRSREEQIRLWNEALKKYGSIEEAEIWASNPDNGLSSHATGRAIDIMVGGGTIKSGGIENQKKSSTFKWLEENAANYGFYNYEKEPWHWEYNPAMPINAL